mgnify:CR=1 FL=1
MELEVTGAFIYFEIPIFGGIKITQTTVSLLVVTILLIAASYFLTRNLTKRPGRMQVIVEKLISMLYGLVEDTMGKHNLVFAPYIGTLFLCSIVARISLPQSLSHSAVTNVAAKLCSFSISTAAASFSSAMPPVWERMIQLAFST